MNPKASTDSSCPWKDGRIKLHDRRGEEFTHSKEDARLLQHSSNANLHCPNVLVAVKDGDQFCAVVSSDGESGSKARQERTHPGKRVKTANHKYGCSSTHQMNGATKLNIWKLRRRSSASLSGSALIPRTRVVNAAKRRESVTRATIFQKLKAR